MEKIKLSLILPCYNESEHFQNSSELIYNTLKKENISFEIIFVEDKSKDDTAQLIKYFLRRHKTERVRAMFHKKNQGRGSSVVDGIKSARGIYVGFIDVDCEVSPEYIPSFIKKLEQNYDVVCGNRMYRISITGFVRASVSRIYSQIMKILLNTNLEDTESGYKFFRKDAILPALNMVKEKGWFWDTEIMVRAEKLGLKIAFLPVEFNRRTDKTSTVNLFSDSIDYFKKLLAFRYTLKNEDYENKDIDIYWQKKSPAFSNQYATFFGVPMSMTGFFLQLRHQKITRILKNLPGVQMLDIGSGSGIFIKEGILLGKKVIGVDYSKQMIDTAYANLSEFSKNKYQLIKGSALKLPIPGNSQDIVLASGLTDYLKKDETGVFMREVSRVLKKNGSCIITFPKKESPLAFLRNGWGLKIRKLFLKLPPLETTYTLDDVKEFCRNTSITPLRWDDVMSTMRIMIGKKQ